MEWGREGRKKGRREGRGREAQAAQLAPLTPKPTDSCADASRTHKVRAVYNCQVASSEITIEVSPRGKGSLAL